MTEREAIVAWLRKEAGYSQSMADDDGEYLGIRASAEVAAFTKRLMADLIESGAHLENKDG